MNIASLFARIGIKADTPELLNFQKQLGNVVKTFGVISIAAGTFTAAVSKITSEAMASASAFKQFETETGSSAQELQKWQAVANQTNSSAEALASSIKAISANREAIKMGGGNISAFQLLGIDPNQDPFEILEQLRTKTAGMNEAMRRNVLSSAGVSSELLRVLELSNDEFEIMAGRAFIISPSAINALDRARGMLHVAGNAFNYIKTQIAVGLTPAIERLSMKFADFVKKNERSVVKFFSEGARYVEIFAKAIVEVVTWFDRFVRNSVGWRGTILGLVGLFTALNAAVMLPILGIVLLIAIIEDLMAYTKGEDSLFGRLFEQFPVLKGIFDAIISPVKELFELLGAIFSGNEKEMQSILDSWGTFGAVIEYIVGKVQALYDIIKSLLSGDGLGAMREQLQEMGLVGNAINNIMDVKSGEKNVFQAIGGTLKDTFANSPLGNLFGMNKTDEERATGGSSNLTTTIQIDVNGAQSPEATGRAIVREIEASTGRRIGIVE